MSANSTQAVLLRSWRTRLVYTTCTVTFQSGAQISWHSIPQMKRSDHPRHPSHTLLVFCEVGTGCRTRRTVAAPRALVILLKVLSPPTSDFAWCWNSSLCTTGGIWVLSGSELQLRGSFRDSLPQKDRVRVLLPPKSLISMALSQYTDGHNSSTRDNSVGFKGMALCLSETKRFVRPHSMKDSHSSRELSKIQRQLNRRLPRWLSLNFGVMFCIIGLVFLELMVSCLVGGGGLHAISRSRYFLHVQASEGCSALVL